MTTGEITDSFRIDWLERIVQKSQTGISFDRIPAVEGERSGFRFMRRFFIGEPKRDLRSAIDAAIRIDAAIHLGLGDERLR